MTSNVKKVCDKIKELMASYRNNNHDLLYEKTMLELSSLSYNGIFATHKELSLYRVRLNEKNNEPFNKTSDLNYAPPEFVCSYGRVNKPGQSMFYCSEFQTICNLELLHDYLLKNDIGHERYATCSKWKIKDKVCFLVVATAPHNREYVNGYKLKDDCLKYIKSQPLIEQNNYFNLYSLTDCFFLMNAKNDYSVYVVCSAIANYLTLQFPNIDGLIYPTVQATTGYNFALRPHSLDKKMIFLESEVSMEKWNVTSKNHLNVSEQSKKGHINAENIIWND